MNLIDRLTSQLDTLVAFLALSRQEVFAIIQQHHSQWFAPEEQPAVPDSYSLYQTQVAHAAFLLGHSYAEAFLADLMREIYLARPVALPRDKELKFRDVLELSTYDDVVGCMVDKEVFTVMYNSMENMISYFENRLGIEWPSSQRDGIVEANLVRNCIVHNNARVDARLAAHSARWTEGAKIALAVPDVHAFGIAARATARDLYRQVRRNSFRLEKVTATESWHGRNDAGRPTSRAHRLSRLSLCPLA